MKLMSGSVIGREPGYTLDRSAVHYRATETKRTHNRIHITQLTEKLSFSTTGRSYSSKRKTIYAQGVLMMRANSMQKYPRPGFNPGPSLCKATVLATATMCNPCFKQIN
ncbi:hypothetical protein AMECASPLE_010512 [Ameca splendens]|uniref:Uncharacterized protein n=1 Tax=Ameca splendens TaxID=208324 RepID=A0ABV0ZWE4_9TELE